MSTAITDLATLLREMQPVLQPGCYVFCTLPNDLVLPLEGVIASIREAEGMSVVLPEAQALAMGLSGQFRAAWITLNVHSDLAALGLTAAFSRALSAAGISCNVVAGNYHDHIFVPFAQAQLAMQVLCELR
jgi:uncharacterized protein